MPGFFDIALMTSNYSHDVATAVLAVSGVMMWFLWREFSPPVTGKGRDFLVSAYRILHRAAGLSLLWIILAGIPRIAFYRQYDWSDAAGDLQIVAVVIKHVVMFVLVGTGLFFWMKLRRHVAHTEKNTLFRRN